MFKKTIPLFKCTVVHSISGRIRLNCRALKYLSQFNTKIQKQLGNIHFIKNSSINNITSNILIHYDKNLISQDQLINVFEEVISSYSLIAYKYEREEQNKEISFERSPKEESTKTILKRIALNLGTLSYSLFKKNNSTLGVNSSIYSKFTTVPAMASMYLTLPLFKNGFGTFKKSLKPNADTLTITSIIASLLLGKDISALTVILLSDVAELLTSYTMEKTRDSIKNMLALNEEYVWKQLEDKSIKKVPVKEITKEDVVVINTGEKICVDGKVISGEAVVDQSAITGEFVPDIKRRGSYVFAGTIVKNGTITVSTEKAGDDTVVSRIIHLVEDAASQKAPIQDYADKFAGYLVPFNFIFAGITYWVTKNPARALNMLIIDYSCGIKLSTATAFSAAINTAVKNGVLVKGGNYIEVLANADTLIFDKTGTLTEGKPQITSIIPANNNISEKELIEIASAAEETSSHPMGVAVMSTLRQEGLTVPKHSDIITYIARGTKTTIDDKTVLVGNKAFMVENNIDTSIIEIKSDLLISKGESVVYVAFDKEIIGVLGMQDKMRANMRKAINNLRYKGMDEIMLLTGDLKEQAEIVANKMGVDSYEAELLPENKAQTILKLQSQGSKVIMIGDGVNDAPALAYANAGIALGGSSTDVAMEASDITIQSNNPMMLPTIVDLSKQTMNIVKQNFGLVLSINSIGLLLSAADVLSVLGGAILHNSSTIFVVSNSLRLLFYDMGRGV